MGKAKVIEWKNIYYMICYCVDELKYFDDSLIKQEEIKGTHDLLAQLLINSFEVLYRNGYIKKYRHETILTDKPHGRIDIAESLRTGSYKQGKLVCNIDTMDINNKINQIIKSAFTVLIESNNIIDDKISDSLLTQLYYCRDKLKSVENITINSQLLSNKIDIPQWYRPIFAVCKMILSDWLALDETGNTRLLELNDNERLCYIWEKFVRNLLEKELGIEYNVSKPSYRISAKKRVNPDILVYNNDKDKVIVADCKWYEYTQSINANMYQAVTYGEIVNDKYSNKEVISIIIYASNSETHLSDIRDKKDNKGRFIVEEWQINVNQHFESLKQDIMSIILNHLDSKQVSEE